MIRLIFLNAIRNIRRNKIRALFSVFIIGTMVLLFIILNTISGMLTEQFARALMQYNLVIQSHYANSPLSSHIDPEVYKQMKDDAYLTSVDAVSITRFNRDGNRLWIVGVSDFPAFATKFGVLIQRGHLFQRGQHEIIAGNQAVSILRHGIGDNVTLNSDDQFKISGIFSSFFSLLNSAVLMDLDFAKKLSSSKKSISMILVNVKADQNIDEEISILRHKYPELVVIKTEQIGKSMTTLRDIMMITLIISWLVFTAAAIAILNTLLITTMQRTREIGILSAIGWPKFMIVLVFLTESMLLSALAALGGLVLSKPMLWIIRHYTSLSIYIPDSISADVVYKVGVMAFFVGLVGVIAPMIYIFKMNISEALRHE